jgi:hypothetical protein
MPRGSSRKLLMNSRRSFAKGAANVLYDEASSRTGSCLSIEFATGHIANARS